jgi:hypothetical protein
MENLNELENKIIQENKKEEENNTKSKMNLRKQKKIHKYYEGKKDPNFNFLNEKKKRTNYNIQKRKKKQSNSIIRISFEEEEENNLQNNKIFNSSTTKSTDEKIENLKIEKPKNLNNISQYLKDNYPNEILKYEQIQNKEKENSEKKKFKITNRHFYKL